MSKHSVEITVTFRQEAETGDEAFALIQKQADKFADGLARRKKLDTFVAIVYKAKTGATTCEVFQRW